MTRQFRLILLSLFFSTSWILFESLLFAQPLDQVNSGADDYGPFVFPNGKRIFFQSQSSAPKTESNFWQVRLRQQGISDKKEWGRRQIPDFLDRRKKSILNTEGYEGGISIFFRGEEPQQIVFTSLSDVRTGRDGYDGLNLYMSERVNIDPASASGATFWKKPLHMDALNSDFDDAWPSISADGSFLVFSSDRPGGYGAMDLWISFRDQEKKWSAPVNLGRVVNTAFNEITPSFAPDSKALYFSSDRPGGHGGYDLYLSTSAVKGSIKSKPSSTGAPLSRQFQWRSPEHLPFPYNTGGNDEAPNPNDGKYLYFSSDRVLVSGHGQGFFNLFRLPLLQNTRRGLGIPVSLRTVRKEKNRVEDVSAVIELRPKRETRSTVHGDSTSGRFFYRTGETQDRQTLTLAPDLYSLRVAARGFRSQRHTLDLRDVRERGGKSNQAGIIRRVYVLEPLTAIGQNPSHVDSSVPFQDPLPQSCLRRELVCLSKIRFYFALNRATIREKEKKGLQVVAQIMQAFPTVRLRVEGHADITGQENFNQILSLRRAQAIRAAIVGRKIMASRLESKGLGSSQPPAGKKGKEDAKYQRRVELVILP